MADFAREFQAHGEPETAWKFMSFHRPATREMGGHWKYEGAWGGHFYSNVMVGLCPFGKDHIAEGHKFLSSTDNCDCGIYSILNEPSRVATSGYEGRNSALFHLKLYGSRKAGRWGNTAPIAYVIKAHPHESMDLSDQDKKDFTADTGIKLGETWKSRGDIESIVQKAIDRENQIKSLRAEGE